MEAGVSLEVSEWANMKGESEKNLIVIPLSFSLRAFYPEHGSAL